MSQETSSNDALHDFEKKQLPSGLNVLTILSFIGCSLQLLSSVWTFFTAQKSYDERDKMIERMNSPEMPSWAKSMMPDMTHFEETIIKSYENRIPLLILALVSVALCFYGVMQMRKLKKQGFMFYVIGELMPFVTMALFIGTFALSGFWFYVICCIALLFILLYAAQRKHFVN